MVDRRLPPIVVSAIKDQRESVAVIAAMKGELNETAYRLALSAYNTAIHIGLVDRDFIKWVKNAVVLYGGSEPTKAILESLKIKLALSDEQLSTLATSEAAPFNKALALVKFAVPFVDARVPAWHAIPAVVHLDLQSVRSDIRLLDDIVEQSRTYFNLTFSHEVRFDYASLITNLRGLYEQYLKRCRITTDRMHRLHALL